MERTPEELFFVGSKQAPVVSILVVVERTPEVVQVFKDKKNLESFNPCCSGKDS